MDMTTDTLTLSLATAYGAYMVAAGLSGLIARDRWAAILAGFRENAALTYISGVFVFAIGTALILVHNRWGDGLAGFVSLIGWVAALEGLVLIVLPAPLLRFAASLLRPAALVPFAGITLIAGLGLLVMTTLKGVAL